MSQTRQPIHVFPKIALKLGFWGRATIILVILTIIASYLLYYHGIRYKNRELAHYEEIVGQLQLIKEQQVQTQSKNVVLQQQVDQLQAQLGQLKTAVQPMQKQAWLLKQVGHYVELAEQHLWLQHNSQSAVMLLQTADQLLAEYGTHTTLSLREAIAQDVLALSQNQQIDYAGLSLQLDALKQSVNEPMALQKTPQVTPQSSSSTPQNAWDKGWAVLKGLISIQHYDNQHKPLLAQDQRWLVQQNVYLSLHQAQLALWQQQQARYQQSLNEAANLLQPYQHLYPQYATWLQQIQSLAAVDLSIAQAQLNYTPKVLAKLITAEQVEAPLVSSAAP
ncbi:MAG: uroporphyrinogen-III C-methyltransferase [Moraxellaceae bacterium]|nr:uroporphyrinogen-III C-methyltransferase [Moraxellaceae bacterium]